MFKWLKRVFSAINRYYQQLFAKGQRFLQREIPAAISVVEVIKAFVNTPATPLLTALIPGQVDDAIVAKVKEVLPQILLNLKIAGECSKLTDKDQIVQCAIRHLRTYEPRAQHAYFLSIASMLSEYLVDGKLSWGEIVQLVEYTYQQKKASA